MKVLIISILISLSLTNTLISKPKVFVFTDINLAGGDPDDRQSLIHLLWYSDELEILGIVPDRWNGRGYEACMIGLEAYRQDYAQFGLAQKGFTSPEKIKSRILRTEARAIERLKQLVNSHEDPIYVLVWGSMVTVKNALLKYPEISQGIRLLSIGTGVKYGPKDEVAGEDCSVVNWNGRGRNVIFNDQRFDDMWWIESNWTYNGMFEGDEPEQMFEKLSQYGAMGQNIKDVTQGHDWAQYFRVGDTPSVTYLLDPEHDINDPESSSWAGQFKKVFPETKPNYYTDHNGPIVWDYRDPCNSWDNVKEMYAHNKSTLVAQRQKMYQALIQKLDRIYKGS